MNLENWYWWTYLQDWSKNEDLQNRVWTQWGKERVGCTERGALTHIHYMSNREPVGSCCAAQELSLGLCDNREGWEAMRGSGRFRRGGTYAYLWLIHVVVWKKPTQYCKAIILQLKKKVLFSRLAQRKKKPFHAAFSAEWFLLQPVYTKPQRSHEGHLRNFFSIIDHPEPCHQLQPQSKAVQVRNISPSISPAPPNPQKASCPSSGIRVHMSISSACSLAVWPWANSFTSLCIHFPIGKTWLNRWEGLARDSGDRGQPRSGMEWVIRQAGCGSALKNQGESVPWNDPSHPAGPWEGGTVPLQRGCSPVQVPLGRHTTLLGPTSRKPGLQVKWTSWSTKYLLPNFLPSRGAFRAGQETVRKKGRPTSI